MTRNLSDNPIEAIYMGLLSFPLFGLKPKEILCVRFCHFERIQRDEKKGECVTEGKAEILRSERPKKAADSELTIG